MHQIWTGLPFCCLVRVTTGTPCRQLVAPCGWPKAFVTWAKIALVSCSLTGCTIVSKRNNHTGVTSIKTNFGLYQTQPFPKQALVFTCLQYKSFENTVGNGYIFHNEQFLLFH